MNTCIFDREDSQSKYLVVGLISRNSIKLIGLIFGDYRNWVVTRSFELIYCRKQIHGDAQILEKNRFKFYSQKIAKTLYILENKTDY